MLEIGENFVVLNMVQNVPANNVFKNLQVIQVRETDLWFSDRTRLSFLKIGEC